MTILQTLKQTESIKKILGKVEIETIIKRINCKKLKQTERNYLSRSIRPKLMAAHILCQEEILEKISRPKKINIKDKIIFNLSLYGYDLITSYKIKKQEKLSIYELIIKILIQEPSPRFIEAIPIILIKNKINPYTLLEFTARYDLKNKIGYLLETSFFIAERFKLKNINYLRDLLKYLKRTKDKEIGFFGDELKEEEYTDFLKRTTPKRMKEWNLLGRYFDDSFINNAGTYIELK